MGISFKWDKVGKITKQEDITFSLESSGLYIIEVTARVWGEKQLGGSNDEDLRVEIDGRKFPQLKNSERYLDSPASLSGGQLHGLKKTVLFIIQLSAGSHVISLIPDITATVEKSGIYQISDSDSRVNLLQNITAEDGDRRPWITLALVDLGLNDFSVDLILKRRLIDSDDVKVIIDGEIKRNYRSILHKLWYFAASVLISENQAEKFITNLSPGLHYLELWADRMPVLNSIAVSLNKPNNKIQKYEDNKFNRNYNKLDEDIIKAVDFWNNFFLKQAYPPSKPLDPSLVKAIVYRESLLGYYPDANIIDVMQVWNPKNPTQSTLLGSTPEYEFVNPEKIEFIHKFYPQGKIPRVDNREESIFWGVRWLYHKAQYILGKNSPYKRGWLPWRDTIKGYNANPAIVEKYLQEVFSVYEKGVDLEGNVLWQK